MFRQISHPQPGRRRGRALPDFGIFVEADTTPEAVSIVTVIGGPVWLT